MADINSIQTFRENCALSRIQLAEQMGVSELIVLRWENEEEAPNFDQMITLSGILGKSVQEISDCFEIPEPIALPGPEAPEKHKHPRKRKTLIIISVICLLLITGLGTGLFLLNRPPSSPVDPETIGRISESVLKLELYGPDQKQFGTASGFIAFEPNVLVTCFHVISDAYTIKGISNDNLVYDITEVIAYDEQRDIAILRISGNKKFTPLELHTAGLQKGDPVVALGSPKGFQNIVSSGLYNGLVEQSDRSFIQFNASISSGSSGGVLLDQYGNVIGMTSAVIPNSQNLNLAVPARSIAGLFSGTHEAIPLQVFYNSRTHDGSQGFFGSIDELLDGQEPDIEHSTSSNSETDSTNRPGNGTGTGNSSNSSSGKNENNSNESNSTPSSSRPASSESSSKSDLSTPDDSSSSSSVDYLSVTLQELISSPQRYNGVYVKLTGWISGSYLDANYKNEFILVGQKEHMLSSGIISSSSETAKREKAYATGQTDGSPESGWARMLVNMDSFVSFPGGSQVTVYGRVSVLNNRPVLTAYFAQVL